MGVADRESSRLLKKIYAVIAYCNLKKTNAKKTLDETIGLLYIRRYNIMRPITAALLNIIPGLGLYMLGFQKKAGMTFLVFLMCLTIPLLWVFLPCCFVFPAVQSFHLAKQ